MLLLGVTSLLAGMAVLALHLFHAFRTIVMLFLALADKEDVRAQLEVSTD